MLLSLAHGAELHKRDRRTIGPRRDMRVVTACNQQAEQRASAVKGQIKGLYTA